MSLQDKSSKVRWAVLTGEYPPQPGGVADYTAHVARNLAASGDTVVVYAPSLAAGETPAAPGVSVHRLPDHFGPGGLLALDRALTTGPRPDRILIQYVPHAYGWKAMNLAFVGWASTLARRVAPVWVMFHEVNFPFRWRPASHAVLGCVTQAMAHAMAGAADRVFVSIPGWAERLRRLNPRIAEPEWLPIPSNVASDRRPDPGVIASRFPGARERVVIGHFGTYGRNVTDLLGPVVLQLLDGRPDRVLLLLGREGEAFRQTLVGMRPSLGDRVVATGELPPQELVDHLTGCDVLVQPYPDGLSTRRSSAMAGLALGRPTVSNLGELSEPFWATAGCVRFAPGPDSHLLSAAAEALLLDRPEERAGLGARAAALYTDRFSIENTIRRLRSTPTR